MLSRSAGKPILVGLSAAALVAAGGATAWAADPTTSPSPSDSATPTPTPTEPKGSLKVLVTSKADGPKPGTKVELLTTITAVDADVADVKVTAAKVSTAKATLGGACVEAPFAGAACNVEKLAKGATHTFTSTVTLDDGVKVNTPVTFTITVDGAELDPISDALTVTYVVPKDPPKPTPKPTPSLTPGEGEGPSDGKSGKDDDGSSSGGSGSGSGSSGSGSGSSGGTYVPPSPNGSFNPSARSPQVALPPIAQPSPAVAAPPAPPTPNSRLRGNERPVAQDLTFERMASTQIAWLAALLVVISLLLTQIRLGRRGVAVPVRPRGTHRRPRRGVFAK
ncbi:hypothetical protein [Spirillospora sp. NPDC047279]|uniref:hypothetical protein n=1 Tax=Spirillospora sp. NPDC047279 TaxID=3155478 RepID=UPI003409ED86